MKDRCPKDMQVVDVMVIGERRAQYDSYTGAFYDVSLCPACVTVTQWKDVK